MQTTEKAAPVRPVTLEEAPCRICSEEVDLRRACVIFRSGKVAHVRCYTNALDVALSESIRRAAGVAS